MMKKENSCSIKTSIGGQALIEGIMMRGPKRSAMAVRNPQGEIVVEEWDTKGGERAKFFKLPIIRGVYSFVDSMVSGYKCLMRSAEISGLEELEEEERRAKEAKKAEKAAKKAAKKGIELPAENPVDLYIASMNDEANIKAAELAAKIRDEGVACLFDTVGRSLKAQMKFANKMGVLFTAVLGTDEIEKGVVNVKCMADGTETPVELDNFAVNFINMSIDKAIEGFNGTDFGGNI